MALACGIKLKLLIGFSQTELTFWLKPNKDKINSPPAKAVGN